MRLSGALQKKRNSELSYREMVKNSSNDETIAAKQVTGVVLQQAEVCWGYRSPLGLSLARWLGRAQQLHSRPGQSFHPQMCAWHFGSLPRSL